MIKQLFNSTGLESKSRTVLVGSTSYSQAMSSRNDVSVHLEIRKQGMLLLSVDIDFLEQRQLRLEVVARADVPYAVQYLEVCAARLLL